MIKIIPYSHLFKKYNEYTELDKYDPQTGDAILNILEKKTELCFR